MSKNENFENFAPENVMPVMAAKSYICVGVAPYDFVPKGETERRQGYGVWFLEEDKQGCYGQIPFRAGFNVDAFHDILMRNNFDSPAEFVGKKWQLLYNRYGKADGVYPAV